MEANEVTIGSLVTFLQEIYKLNGGDIVYRGQSNAAWEVESTAYRRLKVKNNGTPRKLLKYNEDLIAKARRYRGREFKWSIPTLHLIAKLRHNEAATILIDFTQSAMTALWFACQKTKDEKGKETDGKVFCLDLDNDHNFREIKPEDEDKDLSYILGEWLEQPNGNANANRAQPPDNQVSLNASAKWEPPLDNRVLKQDSFFLFAKEGKLDNNIFTKVITIKKNRKGKILEQLKKSHYLSEKTIFPDFYGFAQNNKSNKAYGPQEPEDIFKLALRNHRQGNYIEAIRLYGEVTQSDPDFVSAYNNRGNVKAMLGRYEEAIADFDEALKRDSDFVRAYSNRGNAKFVLGRYDDAIKDHDEALKRDSDFATAYNNRGNAKFVLRRYDDAIEDFDDAIRLAPNSAPTHSNRANAKAMLGRDDEALEDFDKVIQLAPDFAPAYLHRGNFKLSRNRYEEAIEDFDKAISLKPDYAEAYHRRGLAKRALGLDDEAQKDFKKANELDPERFRLDDDANPI